MIAPRAVRLAVGALVLLALGTTAPASAAPAAATVDVTIENFAFSPASVAIEKGDTIRWTNLDTAPHSAVTAESGFVTAVLSRNQTTTTTFDRAGTFDYICGVHGASMKGTVVVRGAPGPETPAPSRAVGHIVVDTFAEPRPDRIEASSSSGAPFLVASAVLALLVLARFVWVVRSL